MIGNKNENREKTNDQKNMIALTTTITPKPGNGEDQGKKKT
jgi:hypothetical protein